jgi:transposase
MAILQKLTVTETAEELIKLIDKSTSSTKPRLKMLLAIVNGIPATNDLAHKTKSNRDSIRKWKNTYRSKGLEGLLREGRGGNRQGALNDKQKAELEKKLSNPKGGFTSYKQATDWINTTFGVEMNYHAVNMYLKRNFGTKLKVGRKTHVNKDENATALFKKPVTKAKTH